MYSESGPGVRSTSMFPSWETWPEQIESRTPMHAAAFAGLDKYITRLATLAFDIEALDSTDRTAMHCAAQEGHSSCIRVLLSLGARSHVGAKSEQTPLVLAAQNNHEECVELLLGSGLDSNVPKPDDHASPTSGWDLPYFRDVLHRTIRAGHVETVQVLLRYLSDNHLLDACRFAMHCNQPKIGLAILNNARFDLGSVSSMWSCQANPLYKAAATRSLPCIRKILSLMPQDADWQNCACACGCGTPLHAFVACRKSTDPPDRVSTLTRSTFHALLLRRQTKSSKKGSRCCCVQVYQSSREEPTARRLCVLGRQGSVLLRLCLDMVLIHLLPSSAETIHCTISNTPYKVKRLNFGPSMASI